MFAEVAATESNPKWPEFIRREVPLYERTDDTRSEFTRDFNRILHCRAYRRLKHKTQVFFAPENDHVCTRMEHVNHVTAISYTISKHFELNTELTNAIAIGHDLGHAPFGHAGSDILDGIANRNKSNRFWHEKNSLWFVDNLETLPDLDNKERNLSLTYAVRDGIICHCGEVDDESIYPREDVIDLQGITKGDEIQPITWEGCVVKVADKIAFLGRDIEDAVRLGIIPYKKWLRVSKKLMPYLDGELAQLKSRQINNTILIHSLISDLFRSSSPKSGIRFSKKRLELIKRLRGLSEDLIYNHSRLRQYKKHANLVLESIFGVLLRCYTGYNTIKRINAQLDQCPLLKDSFSEWLVQYTDIDLSKRTRSRSINKIVYDIDNRNEYIRSIIDYISGMTDNFALNVYQEMIRFM